MRFQDIPGQSELKGALVQAITKSKLAHGQLFSGNEGGAALPLALAYSAYVMCTDKSGGDSCGKCANCQKVHKGIHPDLHLFFPRASVKESEYDKKISGFLQSFRQFIMDNPFGLLGDFSLAAGFENKNLLISKEDSRRLIRTVSMKSVEGGHKIILIWMPEYFHSAGANAILKVLEEPPANTLFLLVTHAYHSLLSTITSRTLLFNIPPIAEDDIQGYLLQKGVPEESAVTLAKLAHGSIGEALQLSTETQDLAYKDFQDWMRECLNNQFTALSRRAETFGQSGKLAQRSTLQFAIDILRETLVSDEPELSTRSGDEGAFMKNFNKFLTLERKFVLYGELNEALQNLDRNANSKMTHFHLSSTFSKILVR